MMNSRDISGARNLASLTGKLFLLSLTFVLMGAPLAQAEIIFTPTPLVLDDVTTFGDVVIDYTGGGSAGVAGYSLDLVWDTTIATAEFARPDSGPFATAVTFFIVDLGEGHVRIDAAIGGEDPGIDSGQLCKITFTAAPAVLGSTSLDLTILSLRDSLNQDVTGVTTVNGQVDVDTSGLFLTQVVISNDSLAHTDDFVKDTDAVTITATVTDDDPGFGVDNLVADLSALGGAVDAAPDSYLAPTAVWTLAAAVCTPADGTLTVTVTATDIDNNTASGGDTITADNTPPTALLGVTALPGHQQLHLAWDDIAATDANPLGVEFRANAWGDYPAYDLAEPAYPADHTEGTLALQTTEGTTGDWPVIDRDIYYVSGFAYDIVLLYSPAGTENTGRATNYWLGDVGGDSGVDGVVDVVNDITQLGNTYGLPDTDGSFDPLCDVGPTDTGSPRGIPQPNDDHEVGFEDMMVFALNYSVVTPDTKALSGGQPVLAWERIAESIWALNLLANGGDLQGLNLRADLPDGLTCSVQKGELAAAQSSPTFLRNVPGGGLDTGLAIFGQGAGFAGEGELVRVTFSEPVADINVTVAARDAENSDLPVQLSPASQVPLPVLAVFGQNFPNPFNPRTTLAFSIPQARHVKLAVYGLDGTLIRTLVNAPREAGSYEVVWNGCDEAGRPVATGTYFARIQAGDFREIRKMVLVK
jgi:hypothetical protein